MDGTPGQKRRETLEKQVLILTSNTNGGGTGKARQRWVDGRVGWATRDQFIRCDKINLMTHQALRTRIGGGTQYEKPRGGKDT